MTEPRHELAPGVVTGEFFAPMDDGRLRCDVCPRFCTLHDGQRGFCFVRERRGDAIVLTSYGRSSGFCIDPIEKKPLNHFLPGTPILSFGTAGCNLGCRFCQNWDISKAKETERLGAHAYPDEVAAAAAESGCTSVAFTYNDPVIFHEYAVDTAQACRDRGIKAVAVSAGYIAPAARRSFFQAMDAANIDLKAFSERFYHKICFAHLDPVLDTLRYLKHETAVWFEITTLLIPDENDSEDEVARLCDWVAANLGPDVPVHFTAFHPDFKMLDKERTSAATCMRARAQGIAAGLHYVYTGNIHDQEGQSTYCPGCGALAIARDGYTLGAWNVLAAGPLGAARCRACQTPLAGVFTPRPGTWGSRRMTLRMRPWSAPLPDLPSPGECAM